MIETFSLLVFVCSANLTGCQMLQCEPRPTMEECRACRHLIADSITPDRRVVGQGECATPVDLSPYPKGS